MLLHDIPTRALAAAGPAAPALTVGDTTLTFAGLERAVARLAAGVAARTGPGARVAILAHNRAEYVTAYYAVPAAGRILVPLNPRLHPAEWDDQLRRSGAELLLAESDLADALAATPEAWEGPVVRFATDSWSDLTAPGRPAPAHRPADTDVAWLLFTSGSTGRPKGVRLTHRSLLAAITATLHGRPVDDDAVFLTPFPLCHVAGYQVLMHHHRARPAVVLRRFTPDAVPDAARRHRVTTLSLAPTMLDALLDHVAARPGDLADLRATVRSIGYGASPIGPGLLRRTREVLGCDLNQGYGSTELSGNAVFLDAADHRAALEGAPELLKAAGRPAPGVDLRIVDDAGDELPPGVQGEIAVRAAQVCDGYWEDPGATAQAFADGRLRTGDLGHVDARGYLFVTDRKKDVIVSGGENVSAREVESVLLAHPRVREAAVVGAPDARWGERVCAVVVVEDGTTAPVAADELEEWCRASLAGFKVPRRVVFVDALPVTGTGKVAKGVLREQLAG